MKFIVGRGLRHVKFGHGELTSKAFALMAALQAVDLSLVPDRFHNMLPDLAMGWMLSLSRESEISSDRAGVLCCDGQVAGVGEALKRKERW